MKTTIDIPDALFREAKATAARRGRPLREFVTEAVAEKLEREQGYEVRGTGRSDWPVPPMKLTREEAEEIDRAIEEAFEQIEPDDLQ